MVFKHHLPPAQEQPREGLGHNLATSKNTWEGIFVFPKRALTEVVPAPWLGSVLAVLGALELLTGASPAAPCLGHPVQRALLGRAASSPCPKEQAGVCSKGNWYKNICRWAGFMELWVRMCSSDQMELSHFGGEEEVMLWDSAVQRWMLL